MPVTSKQVQFSTAEPLLVENLESRSRDSQSLGQTAKKLISAYFQWVYPETLNNLGLTKQEFMLLCDLFNGSLFVEAISPKAHLQIGMMDAEEYGYGDKWDVDTESLLNKIKDFSLVECVVATDAIQRFWSDSGSYSLSTEEQLEKVGFVAKDRFNYHQSITCQVDCLIQ